MKRVEAQQIGQIISQAMQQQGLEGRFNEQKLCALWPEVVGPGINRYTTRRFVDHGVLHVFITSGPLKQELSFNKQSLIDALNRAAGSGTIITDVKFH